MSPPFSGLKSKPSKNQHDAASKKMFTSGWFIFVLLFSPEDGGDIFLRIISWYSTDYMALHPRR
jgi:hypothetical protein